MRDTSVLQDVQITSTYVEEVTPKHKTPQLKQWVLHRIVVPADRAEAVAEKLSHALRGKKPHDNWYADFRTPETHYIIFPRKIFKIDRSKPEQYDAAKKYGLSLRIPEYQLRSADTPDE